MARSSYIEEPTTRMNGRGRLVIYRQVSWEHPRRLRQGLGLRVQPYPASMVLPTIGCLLGAVDRGLGTHWNCESLKEQAAQSRCEVNSICPNKSASVQKRSTGLIRSMLSFANRLVKSGLAGAGLRVLSDQAQFWEPGEE